MNIFLLVWSYLKAKPLHTVLNISLLALGIAVIIVLVLFTKQLEEKISENSRGIDLVVGAKGSPLQLILCNIFHVDFPTGNINLKEAERIAKNRLVKKVVPLALGDSYQSYRIIGTNKNFAGLYKSELEQGDWFDKELEVTIGANVARMANLVIGSQFTSAHGLTSGGHAHEAQNFSVKGILKKTNSVVDNLILTSIESVWHVHDIHSNGNQNNIPKDSLAVPSVLVPSLIAGDSTKEITSLLIQYQSAMGAIQLPRIVNMQSSLQAASPAFETARLFSILGVGVDILMAFAYVLIFISALSIFIALYNSLQERRYDLAIMRSMGAPRLTLVFSILTEGVVMTFLGCAIGVVFGHGVFVMMTTWIEQTEKAGLTGFVVYFEEWILLAGSLLLGMFCALIPAWQAYRTDISKVLAGN